MRRCLTDEEIEVIIPKSSRFYPGSIKGDRARELYIRGACSPCKGESWYTRGTATPTSVIKLVGVDAF